MLQAHRSIYICGGCRIADTVLSQRRHSRSTKERVQECNDNRSHGVGGWNLQACQQPESGLESEQFWQGRILVRMFQSCWRPFDVLSLLSSQDRSEMLVSMGAKSLRGHQVRGHQVQVHGCEKKFGQKSDVSLVLGSSARHARAWVGRLQSVALLGNTGGSPIFYSAPDGTTCHPHPLCQWNVTKIQYRAIMVPVIRLFGVDPGLVS